MATQILYPASEIGPLKTQNERVVEEQQEEAVVVQQEQDQGVVADTRGPISIKEVLAQLDGRFPMDEAVVNGNALLLTTPLLSDRHILTYFALVLPKGSTFVSVEHFGTSAWTVTGKVTARNEDGTESLYFLKVCSVPGPLVTDVVNSKRIWWPVGCIWRTRWHYAKGRVRVIKRDLRAHVGFSPRALWVWEIQCF